jgi:23S rRNA pseudouridine2605 synthase
LSPSSAPRPGKGARKGRAAGEGSRPRRNGAAPAAPRRSPGSRPEDQGAASPRGSPRSRPEDLGAAASRGSPRSRPQEQDAATSRRGTPRSRPEEPRAASRRGSPGSRPQERAATRPARSGGGRPAGGADAGGASARLRGTAGGRRVPRPGSEPRAAARETGEPGAGTGLRLNKALSAAGLGSRRAVEDLVRAGRVSVDGEVVHDLGRRVDPARDRVAVDGSRVVLDERRRYWLLNKPAGVISTAADPSGRPTVVGLVPDQPRVFPVGRLDRDTEGLLLLTNDGPLAYRLTHARYGVEKRYLAEVERLPTDAPARLRQGVQLEDGLAKPVRVRVMAGAGRRRMIEVVLVEGRNREVRRLLEAVGAPVRRLVRTAVGPVRLTGLAPGEFRALRPDEIRSLYRTTGL